MKYTFIVLMACLFSTLVSCEKNERPRVEIETETDKALYMIGTKFGNGLGSMNLTEQEAQVIAQGFMDAALGQKLEGMEEEGLDRQVQEFISSRRNGAKRNLEAQGKSFLENFVEHGAKKTASGLAYQIIKEGQGSHPGPADIVEIHYKAALSDGTVFASSRNTGKVAKFPLDKLIQGWAEGVRLIKPGGQIKLVIPPELGYGDNGAPPKVPGGATLVFDVELLSVTKSSKGD